ncbi:hypothetical protein [Streptomyces violascens]|uniref:Secreted protein n=1 Tax=Streptomyces violascens TaxID=67381 RepID=A0ABQ3QK54_9ACTN|nr:hypothetical protein [Streptomyces violascens]GGT94422.1 hypothetical protein GCM10010289_13190 [Streptomyces violascens]GHI37632.1 hypothetical protein Sviol_20400 [Streptomyces violascens]
MGLETRVQIVLELLSNVGVVSLLGPSGLLVLALGVLLAKGGAGAAPREPGPVPAGPRTNLVCVAAVILVLLLIAAL